MNLFKYMVATIVSTAIFTILCGDELPEVTHFTWGAAAGVWITCLLVDIGLLKKS